MRRADSSLEANAERIAAEVVERCFRERPDLDLVYGPAGRKKCLQDTQYHLQYLGEALAADSLPLFLDYVQWAKILLAGVKIPEADLANNFRLIAQVIDEILDKEEAKEAYKFISAGIEALPRMPLTYPCLVDNQGPNGMLAKTYLNLVLAGQPREATDLVVRAADTGTPIRDIYLNVFQPTQREIGRLWQTNQISVAQEHYCSNITERAMGLLYSRFAPAPARHGRRLLATCVGTELHALGIRMVADFLEAEGWTTIFLGANTPSSVIIRTLRQERIDLLALSATMTYHVGVIARIISTLRAEANNVKVLVGGYPFNIDPGLWQRIGADAFGTDAADSARKV
jgi:methanogenic corrinoid protein MtbC1